MQIEGFRLDDGVGDAGFVFDGKKDEAVGSARTLSRNYATGNLLNSESG